MFTTRPELMGTFGVVASTHWLASSAGMAMLEKGGNAFDAAVAAGLTLQVCEPHLNGPGGDLPLIMHCAKTGETKVLCGQGSAPAGATIEHYKGLGLDLVPGSGLLATVVPGAFDAWMLMLRDHGELSLEEVFEPALAYAANGVPLVERVCMTINVVKELFQKEWPTSAALFLPGGEVPRPGTLLGNTQLAATWQRILDEAKAAGSDRAARIDAARGAFYRGFVAEAMDRFCRENEVMDVSGERHSGVLSADDLANWQARYEDPLTYDYRGYTVCKTGPWGQGPALLQQLALLEEVDLGSMDPTGADFVHVVVEAAKLAFADREKFYGDPDFADVPMDTLLSDQYNAARRALIDNQRASLEFRSGDIPGFGAEIDYAQHIAQGPSAKLDRLGVGEPTMGRAGEAAGDTCHIDVIDRHGNMVSATPSGGW
ncbi:MAG: gamma-glutamyltransferase, partial [Pseudomonadales bacterium]